MSGLQQHTCPFKGSNTHKTPKTGHQKQTNNKQIKTEKVVSGGAVGWLIPEIDFEVLRTSRG